MLQKNPYQLIALLKLRAFGAGFCLIADGVGVGKTVSSGYIIADSLSRDENVLIISPPSLVDKWILEMKSHFDLSPRSIRSFQEYETAQSEMPHASNGLVYVMNGALLQDRRLRRYIKPGLLVVDEIHNYRNADTLSHRTLAGFAAGSGTRIGLSATPINNGLQDLVSIFQILWPGADRDALDMAIRDYWESRKHAAFSPIVTRFDKENIGIHFARRVIHSHSISYPETYMASAREYILKRCEGKSTFERLIFYRLAASSPAAISHSIGVDLRIPDDPKVAALQSLINNSDRTLVFCEFRKTVEYLCKNLEAEVITLTGDIPLDERQAALDAFRDEEDSVLLMTSVGSEGLDVQFCSHLVNYDLHWNPMVLEQRIGRIDRRGQKKSEVTINNFHVQNSVDDAIIDRLHEKLSGLNRSVFQPKEIIGRDADFYLFDTESVESELKEAEQLSFAQSWASALQSDDYEIAQHIPPQSCVIVSQGHGGQSIDHWVPASLPVKEWIEEKQKLWSDFRKAVEYYSG